MLFQKKIVFLKNHINKIGGLEKYSYRIFNEFIKLGYDVSVLTTSTIQTINPKINIIPLKASSPVNFIKLKHFDLLCKDWLKRNFPPIIFGLDRTTFQTHLRLGNGVHKAFLERRSLIDSPFKHFTHRFNPLHKTLLEIENRAFHSPILQVLFTNSNMVKEEVIKYYDIDPKKICVLYNGVEWREMEEPFSNWTERKNRIAQKLNLDPSLFHFLFIGNGFKRKGLNLLLKSLANIDRDDFHLSIVGNDRDINSYKKLATKLKLNNKVSFYGPRNDILDFYCLADTLVIPSFYDPFANVTIEALAMGVKVITSKFNGAYEILTSENGLIIDKIIDIDNFTNCLKEALDYPKTTKNAYNIRQTVEAFDFSYTLKKLVDHTTNYV